MDTEATAGRIEDAAGRAGEPPGRAGEAGEAGRAGEAAARVEELMLGGQRRYNRTEVSEATGVDRDRAHRLWMAMGFAEVGDDEAVFTDGDIEALRTWDALVASGTMAIEDEVPHARVMGQTLSRLAEWQAREVMARADALAPDGAGRAAAFDMADTLVPVIEHLQSYVWRRHLAAAYERILLAPPGELSAATMTVGFADIVGYTRTARHAAVEELAALLETFEEDTSEAVVANHGRVVKMVG